MEIGQRLYCYNSLLTVNLNKKRFTEGRYYKILDIGPGYVTLKCDQKFKIRITNDRLSEWFVQDKSEIFVVKKLKKLNFK